MANKAKKIKTGNGLKLEIVNPNAAGIDVSSTEMQVCVPPDRDAEYNRCFGTFTEDLHFISAWLKACQIDTIAMESTGVYWVQLFMILVSDGFDVILGNAKSIKNIGEKKTDEVDAEWIMLLHSYGMIKSSFQPNNFARRIRNLSRHKDNLVKTSSREVLHMQKAMILMNIQLGNVITDILGKSGQAIISSILAGERNAGRLALLADPRCKSSKMVIEKSLVANWDDDLIFMLKQSFELYKFIQQQMQNCDQEIENIIIQYKETIMQDCAIEKECKRSNKKKNKKNMIAFDIEAYGNALFGVNIMRVPGISDSSLLRLTGELGHDFTKNFDRYKEFCCWCNVAPNNKITGGKLISSKLPKRKNPVGQILRQSANSLKFSKTPLGYYFRRIQSKSGYMPAIIATANKIGRIIYTMVKNKREFDESYGQIDESEILKKKLLKTQLALEKIQKQLKECA